MSAPLCAAYAVSTIHGRPQTAGQRLTGDTVATKVKRQTIRFLSANQGLRMQRQTQGERILQNGNVTKDPLQPEVTYEFDRGALELTEGQDMLPDALDPDTGELVEQDAISWLRSTPEYGTRIVEVEPVAPDASLVLRQLGPLAAAKDVAALEALGDEEHASWGREDVLDAIRQTIDSIEAADAA